MARPGRKRKEGLRYPGGQIRPEDTGPSPTSAKRLMIASLAKMADPQWSTVSGIYFLTGKISQNQYEAARRFSTLLEAYLMCLQGPRRPYTSSGERGSLGAPVDVDTDAGEAEADRHIGIMQRYNDAHLALVSTGRMVEISVVKFCDGLGQTPIGFDGLIRTKRGLDSLAMLWKIKEK